MQGDGEAGGVSGVGTIAAGVAKAKADVILISGHNGGTGASPATSIKYAGLPWEMGLTEAHQVLSMNNLRERVTLRTDGGLRTGRDIVMAAMMGAEEYGIGTAALIAMGCIMVRQCQSNTCPVGVCTQDEALRDKFTGNADKVVNLITFYAHEVRELLAVIGARSLDDVIGRADLLTQVSRGSAHLDDLDLNPLLITVDGAQRSSTTATSRAILCLIRWTQRSCATLRASLKTAKRCSCLCGAEHASDRWHAHVQPYRQAFRDAQCAAARSSDGEAARLCRAIAWARLRHRV